VTDDVDMMCQLLENGDIELYLNFRFVELKCAVKTESAVCILFENLITSYHYLRSVYFLRIL